ncbi:MAG: hypothetical protein ACLVGP_00155 [Oscillospiraceae bacterium]
MKKSIICLVSGIVAGIAMCLTAAYFLPETASTTSWAASDLTQEVLHGYLRQHC